ncbi:MAG: MarR family transcriptional regulator [Spirochaetes bacterium]|nr:MarR family transcriptional regulator [Spirochaetota bacterium]
MATIKNESRTDKQKVGYLLLNLIQYFLKIDRKTRYYGTDVPIYYAEIHVIKTIAENPGINIGGLAKLLGITKGSVSEVIKKLEKKGLVIKNTDPRNASRLSLMLTKKAEKANNYHLRYHIAFNEIIRKALGEADDKEVRFLLMFIDYMVSQADRLEQMIKDMD